MTDLQQIQLWKKCVTAAYQAILGTLSGAERSAYESLERSAGEPGECPFDVVSADKASCDAPSGPSPSLADFVPESWNNDLAAIFGIAGVGSWMLENVGRMIRDHSEQAVRHAITVACGMRDIRKRSPEARMTTMRTIAKGWTNETVTPGAPKKISIELPKGVKAASSLDYSKDGSPF